MAQFSKITSLVAIHDAITIQRTSHGIPQITASNREDLCYGIGYVHAVDRLVQMMMVRAIARGRASEYFLGSEDLISLDTFMRWLHLEYRIQEEVEKLSPDVRSELDAYCTGLNTALADGRRPLEFFITGYHPDNWTIGDTILTGKILSYLGLAQAQGEGEKFLIQLIQEGVDEARIRALFPGITEPIDYELIQQITLRDEVVPSHLWSRILPRFHSSNNWVVSGEHTRSGHPILAADPHLEIDRLPPIWYEMTWRIGTHTTQGITMPGLPLMVFGRNPNIAWANTYGFMDMMDYFIEECRDGEYLYEGEWLPFEDRHETIVPKGKQPIHLTFYENHHGVLEGDPYQPGKYLTMAFSGRSGAGAEIFNILMRTDNMNTVREAQNRFRHLGMPTFNWVFADREGNIGYQMCGRLPKRRPDVSGLLPLPGWDASNDWQGYVSPAKFPQCYNPESGFFATANHDVSEYGEVRPISLAMAPYRIRRINSLLQQRENLDVAYIKRMQYDTYSLQAEEFMEVIRPLLPDTEHGRILREWDCTYNSGSVGATLFEAVYESLVWTVFGNYGIGERTIRHLMDNTGVFVNFYGYFDDVLLNEESPWFAEIDRETQFKEAIEMGLQAEALPYGRAQAVDFKNIFFRGKLPGFLGFDEKRLPFGGSRATIQQHQSFHLLGAAVAVGPSYRMIVEIDMDGMWTNLPGGPSGCRFSPWYKTDLYSWLEGEYKKLL